MKSDRREELASADPQPAPDGAEPSRHVSGAHTDQMIAQLTADLADRDAMIDRLRRFIPPIVADGILHDQERLRDERREVTVLFLDAVAFTQLSVSLDAEAVFSLINDLLSRLVACVHHYGGLVDKFTGDGLMAVFGAPIAHENDAELAVRAAIDMQQAASEFAEIARAQLGAPVEIRIGINRGPVIAGILGTQEQSAYTVIGETVNLAARLEALAQPGSIWVSNSVYARTESFFDFAPPHTVLVKGVDAPVEIHAALSFRASPTSPRGVPGMVGPCLGRDVQLAQLHELSDGCLTGRQGRLVTVTGEAGLGKSRLISEWVAQILPDGFTVWRGRGLPYTEGTGYGVFRSLLRDALDDYADPDQWQSRVSEPFRPLIRRLLELPQLESEEVLWEHLGPERTSQLTALAIREWLINEASDHPLVLILDDFHWADDLSRQVLQSLLALISESRILFCIIMRPHAGAGLDSTHLDPAMCYHIAVPPLTESESRVLLSSFVELNGVPDATVETILTRAEGNPFYIEEFVRMLIEQELLHLHDGKWSAVSLPELAKLDLPTSLRGLMLARVDRLPENLRYLLQHATVIGLEFDAALLQVIERKLRRVETIDPMLDRLTNLDLLQLRPAAGPHTYAFRHILTQETVYHSILRSERPDLHRVVAESIEELYSSNLELHVEALALHYDRAHVRDRALHYALWAGKRAQDRFANREALGHYSRALQLSQHLGQTGEARWQAAVGLGDIQQHVGEYEAAVTFYEATLNDYTQAGPIARADVMLKLGRAWDKLGDLEKAESWLKAAATEIANTDKRTPAIEAEIYGALGWLTLRDGELTNAQALLERAASLVETTEEYSVLSSILNRLGAVYLSQGQRRKAAAAVRRSLDIRERLGDLLGVARSSNNLGILLRGSGDWKGALQTYQHSLEAMQTIGDAEGVAIAHTNIGNVYIDIGDWDQAETNLQRSYELAQRIANPYEIAQANMNLGRLYLRKHEHVKAARYLDTALVLYAQVGASANPNVIDAYWLQGLLCLEKSEIIQAHSWSERSFALLTESTGESDGESSEWGRYHQLVGRLALIQGRVSEALKRLTRAKTIFEANGSYADIGRTAYWLAQALMRADELTAARDELTQARTIFEELGAQVDLARVGQSLVGLEEAAQ